MLFNSFAFLLFFLPVAFALDAVLHRQGRPRAAMAMLVAASLFFYAWWNPAYLPLLLASILFNHGVAGRMHAAPATRRRWLVLGVGGNLAAIAWFKYAGFLAGTAVALFGLDWPVPDLVLPLAISFFTFQQIAYLVDIQRGRAPRYDLLRYALFVTFFPQLIAGPIVRHDETVPQFGRSRTRAQVEEDLAVGASFFAVGLFKKVILADTLAGLATPVFAAAAFGDVPAAAPAWGAALAYTFQLYFDFSGYCDMAIGAARIFGIRLPANFDSPYQATSIIDFWRRWHMTLSRFLRDDLYIPLGGNRKGTSRRYANLMITMLLGGLWHGAGWTFVLWGGLHGLYLAIDHGWRALRPPAPGGGSPAGRTLGWFLTFLAVVVAWVLFRAEGLPAATAVYRGMLGANGLGSLAAGSVAWLAAAFAIGLGLPNSQQWMRDFDPVLGPVRPARGALADRLRFAPTRGWATVVALLGLYAFTHLTRVSEFLYFQF